MLLEKVISIVALSAGLMEGSLSAAMPDKDVDGTIFLINRQQVISEEYIPEVRKTDVYGMSQAMRDDAAAALEEMFEAASAEGVSLSSVSGYRSYSRQSTIYARKKKTLGSTEKADLLVALPGTSEHQLGMAMDVAKKGSSQLNTGFAKTDAGQWVQNNAHRFGFVVRYQEGYEEITGYSYEPWHVRYVGKEHAQAIYEAGVPLETYLSAHRLEVYEYLIQLSEVRP